MKKLRLKDELIYVTEMVESEFPEKTWDELFELVYDLVSKNKKFFEMNDADKFDYLVDAIIMLEK